MPRFLAFTPIFALVVILAPVGSNQAQAGLLPVSVTVTPEAGNFTWTYSIVLPTDSQLRTGNYFTIYDFRGFLPGTATGPTGWDFAVSNVGQTPALLAPFDDASLPNLTWTYLGPNTVTSGQVGLGNFSASSIYGGINDSFFTALTNRTSDGRLDANITTTDVPVPAAVPEPTTLVLAGLGLPLAALARRARRNRIAVDSRTIPA
jgi:hypothetical protein